MHLDNICDICESTHVRVLNSFCEVPTWRRHFVKSHFRYANARAVGSRALSETAMPPRFVYPAAELVRRADRWVCVYICVPMVRSIAPRATCN